MSRSSIASLTVLLIALAYPIVVVLSEPTEPLGVGQIASMRRPEIPRSYAAYFEENHGQFPPEVKFLKRGELHDVFLTSNGAVFVVHAESGDSSKMPIPAPGSPVSEVRAKAVAVFVSFVGHNPQAQISGRERSEHTTSYFKGSLSENWRTRIPSFRDVVVKDLYKDTDVVWAADSIGMTDFEISNNNAMDSIEIEIEGAEGISIDNAGDLILITGVGSVRLPAPRIEGKAVGTKFRNTSSSSEVSSADPPSEAIFRVGLVPSDESGEHSDASGEDASGEATLDASTLGVPPYLDFSTYLGGSQSDVAYGVAVDTAGATYVTGYTISATPQFPTTPGAFDITHNGGADVFVCKVNPLGTGLVYSTFIGGFNNEHSKAIEVDQSGNVYLTGWTLSTDFPVTPGSFSTPFDSGPSDIFVIKLGASGTVLDYASRFGEGQGIDEPKALELDPDGNAYITGFTSSPNFPTTTGAFDSTLSSLDCFVTKLNPSGSGLVFSTYLGGSGFDDCYGIGIDSNRAVFLTGESHSADFPTTTGAFDRELSGSNDAFATKLSPDGTSLEFSTLLGGTGEDHGWDIAPDNAGNVIVVGTTFDDTVDFPATIGAYDQTHNGMSDGFIARISPAGNLLLYSSFLGGNSSDGVIAISQTPSGEIVVTGVTQSSDYPTTASALDVSFNGISDATLTRFSSSGSDITYSTYIGGSSLDHGWAISLSENGGIFVAGYSAGFGFPTTPGAFDRVIGGSLDAFVLKFSTTRFSIAGRVFTPAGAPIRNAAVSLIDSSGARVNATTSSFGVFNFNELRPGRYTLIVASKRYRFSPQVVDLASDLTDIQLIGLE